MEAITAGDGTTHVSSADDRELYAGIVGAGCYVCKTGNQLKCTMQTANKAIIGTGAGFMYGTGFRNSSAEEVTIKSGTQAQRRNDIICVHFATDSAGNETAELAVLEGKSTTAAAATDPDIPAGNLLDGATEAWMPLWRIPLDGITVGEPVALFDILVPAAEVWDSVSRTVTVDDRLAESSVWCDAANSQRVCLTARTADRARGHALVASDTSLLLYDLDGQKPIWDMRVQHPIYFSSINSTSLTVTAPHDCVIEVEAWFERQWGYNGGEASLSISTPAGLNSICAVAGRIYGGNTVGRSLHAFGAFSGAKGGKTYTFACSLDGSGTGTNHGNMIARCFPA